MATSKELLTNLADELRTLTNTTDKMGLSKMAEHVADANDEVDSQDALVEQLISAMAGKSVPGGGSGAVETCTLQLNIWNDSHYFDHLGYCCMYLENDEIVVQNTTLGGYNANLFTINNVVCGSFVYVSTYIASSYPGYQESNVEFLYGYGDSIINEIHRIYKITAPAGGTASIKIYDAD